MRASDILGGCGCGCGYGGGGGGWVIVIFGGLLGWIVWWLGRILAIIDLIGEEGIGWE